MSVAEAKAKLSEMLARVEKGERFTITRRGKPVAVVSAPEGVYQPLPSRAELREKLGRVKGSALESLLALRDEARY
jgi:antitoxin (DNA-binding transcriptional repressor) of toxin-antitoxin stability system